MTAWGIFTNWICWCNQHPDRESEIYRPLPKQALSCSIPVSTPKPLRVTTIPTSNSIRYFGLSLCFKWMKRYRMNCFMSIFCSPCFVTCIRVVTCHGLFLLAVPCGTWDLSFPNQTLNPWTLHWKFRVLTTGLPEKSLSWLFKLRDLFWQSF